MVRNERVDHLVQIALHDLIQLIERQVDAMIGHSALREIVSPDTFAAIPAADLALAVSGAFRVRRLTLHVKETRL